MTAMDSPSSAAFNEKASTGHRREYRMTITHQGAVANCSSLFTLSYAHHQAYTGIRLTQNNVHVSGAVSKNLKQALFHAITDSQDHVGLSRSDELFLEDQSTMAKTTS
jgi:hypothetical protein